MTPPVVYTLRARRNRDEDWIGQPGQCSCAATALTAIKSLTNKAQTPASTLGKRVKTHAGLRGKARLVSWDGLIHSFAGLPEVIEKNTIASDLLSRLLVAAFVHLSIWVLLRRWLRTETWSLGKKEMGAASIVETSKFLKALRAAGCVAHRRMA